MRFLLLGVGMFWMGTLSDDWKFYQSPQTEGKSIRHLSDDSRPPCVNLGSRVIMVHTMNDNQALFQQNSRSFRSGWTMNRNGSQMICPPSITMPHAEPAESYGARHGRSVRARTEVILAEILGNEGGSKPLSWKGREHEIEPPLSRPESPFAPTMHKVLRATNPFHTSESSRFQRQGIFQDKFQKAGGIYRRERPTPV